ncbi:DUF7619 domain-containing protein [Winogradskyella poriferorum]|uniref:T9SS type A sorting domain-containing protein n=1 Tax=Winogradskyella poriferorum TaxID=307627 RepID=UPI003D6625DF
MKAFFLSIFLLCVFKISDAQIVNIPDANFKNALVNSNCATHLSWPISGGFNLYDVDLNNNGEIEISEAENIRVLYVDEYSIGSLEGIQYFTNLEYLNCEENLLNQLDLNDMINLEEVRGGNNQISVANFQNSINLSHIDLNFNPLGNINLMNVINLSKVTLFDCPLSNINLQDCTNLEFFGAGNNQFANLDFSSCANLKYLYVSNNQIQSLDLSNNLILEELGIWDNQIAEIDVSNNTSIKKLYVHNNELVNLDVSNNSNLDTFWFFNNPLESLNIKNGTILESNGYNNDGVIDDSILSFICVDEEELNQIQNLVSNTNVVINSYCSFTPGGEYYTIDGESRVDVNTNGCDVGDIFYPNIKLELTDGTNTGTYLADTSGSYSVPVSEGMHTMTPVLENPDYFTVSPTSSTITFPDAGGSYVQDFCLSPNGIHNDVEVVIVPTSGAVPGFDSYYTILYRNKGNIELNGTVSLDFEDDYMDFISALPAETISSIGNLQWNYSNLQPFETRAIEVVFNLNTPTDITFPLNDGDVLDFDISIDPIVNDETISDNTFSLKEIVVNSYDPNDVTCLEGVAILPEHVGEYVHYRIRFENLGTANATNIVVKDVIDTTKFDVSSLIPLHASHNYTTRIRENNIIEFIFEGINLPFDDANNDGYVVFKIKTLETLQLGDTFTNQAEIYFDFNFPVITNMYSTSVQENLSVNDFELNDVVLFPNPVNNQLYIKSNLNIDTIKIFDINGRLIQNKTMNDSNVQNEVSVSALKSGVYFIEVYSNGQKEVLRFIKK